MVVFSLFHISNAQSNDSTGVENWRIGLGLTPFGAGVGLSAIETRKSLKEYEASAYIILGPGLFSQNNNGNTSYSDYGFISTVGVNFFLTNKNKYHRRVCFIFTSDLFFYYRKSTDFFDYQPYEYHNESHEDYYIGFFGGVKICINFLKRFSFCFQNMLGPMIHHEHDYDYSYYYANSSGPFGETNWRFNQTELELGWMPDIQIIYRFK